jgi:hypothetical protein
VAGRRVPERGIATHKARQKSVLIPDQHTADPSARVINGRLYVIASHDVYTKLNTAKGFREGASREGAGPGPCASRGEVLLYSLFCSALTVVLLLHIPSQTTRGVIST